MTKKILIIDDSPTIVAIMKDALESEGYEIITSSDGGEALSVARKEKPDLIILDVMLPHMDGYQICRMLKFDSTTEAIPIIMLTSRSQDKDKKMGLQVGANEYLNKPPDIELMQKTVKDLLNKHKAEH